MIIALFIRFLHTIDFFVVPSCRRFEGVSAISVAIHRQQQNAVKVCSCVSLLNIQEGGSIASPIVYTAGARACGLGLTLLKVSRQLSGSWFDRDLAVRQLQSMAQ
jgi:hypothetical protein